MLIRPLLRFYPLFTMAFTYLALPIALIMRLLVGTLWGVFFLSLAIYWLFSLFGESKPYSLHELILWIDSLQTDSKTAVATSILTIVGFLVALSTSALNSKAERVAGFKVELSNEVEAFFSEVLRLISEARIYVESLIKTVDLIKSGHDQAEIEFRVHHAIEKMQTFISTRDRLLNLSVEVHRIPIRYSLLLGATWGATKIIEECIDAFTQTVDCMPRTLPYSLPDGSNRIATFVSRVDVSECMTFVSCAKQNYQKIAGLTGGLRGQLLGRIIEFNFSSLLFILSNRHSVKEFFNTLRKER